MPTNRYQLIDTAGSELEVVELDADDVAEGATVTLPDGREVQIVEIYDDAEDLDDDVTATLVIEE